MLSIRNIALVLTLWHLVNAVLHTIAVVRNHQGPYDRELLRLVMDGLFLFTCGIIFLFGIFVLNKDFHLGAYLIIAGNILMLLYCILIWPFLKSMVTILLNLISLIWIAISLL